MKQLRHRYLLFAIAMSLCMGGFLLIPQNISSVSDSINHPFDVAKTSGTNPFNLTFTSEWNQTQTVVHTGDRIIGDRIVLNATCISSEEVNHTHIVLNATAVPFWISSESAGSHVTIETWFLGGNHTCSINMTAWLVNGSVISEKIYNVFIGNFFKPHIRVLSPNGGEQWTGVNNVTWVAWDNNSRETLSFDVLLSADEGKSFILLASGFDTLWYSWNCSSLPILDTYMIEVRVSDGTFNSFDRSDNPFTAGEINITPTSTTSIETSTTSPVATTLVSTTSTTITQTSMTSSEPTSSNTGTGTQPPSESDYLLTIGFAFAIMGSAVLAVVAYYLATRKL